MGNVCDDCGADGVALTCICGPMDNVAPTNRVGARGSRTEGRKQARSKPGRLEPKKEPGQAPVAAPSPSPALRAPQSDYRGSKVKCCRCCHIHVEGDRLNEWGLKAGRVQIGRRTECPAGCGYHVTIPVDDE